MRVTVMTVGSRGDIQQYLAIALGLREAGHDVRFATHAEFEPFVRAYGVPFAPIPGNPFQGMNAGLVQDGAQRADESPDARRDRAIREWIQGGLDASRDADALVYSQLCFVGYHVAEALRIPGVWANHTPAHSTSAFPTIYQQTGRSWGGWYNRFTHFADQRLFWLGTRRAVNAARRELLDLPPIGWAGVHARMQAEHHSTLYGFSPRVVPKPADWPDWVELTGFWFLPRPADFTPPPDLVRFLESGPPPVYVGLGSVANTNPFRVTRAIVRAVRRGGYRMLVMPGQVELDPADLPEETFVVRSVPHDWLFPQVACVVHHGGVGTAATAMRGGVPSLGVPFFGDQYFWARRIHEIGVAPSPIRREEATEDNMLAAIRSMMNDVAMRRRAAMLGAGLEGEHGTARFAELFERFVPHGGRQAVPA